MSPPMVVIGAGIVGLSCAHRLAEDGRSVTVIDAGEPGMGASFGNAGAIAIMEVAPLSAPGVMWQVPGWLLDPLGPLALRWGYLPTILPWLLRFLRVSNRRDYARISAAQAALMRTALADIRHLVAQTPQAEAIHTAGAITIYPDARSRERDAAAWAVRSAQGMRHEPLDGEALRRRLPGLAPQWTVAEFTPDWAHVDDPYELVRTLAATATERGVRIITSRVVSIEQHGDRVDALATEDGPVDCDGVVVAAGAWSRSLAGQLGAKVPLDTERGYHLTLPDPGIELAEFILVADGGFVMLPMDGGRVRLAGTVEFGGFTAPPDWRRADRLLVKARRLFPALRGEGASRWMGFRPSLPDSLPVIGPAPGAKNAWLAFGHGHLGLTQSGVTGRLVADLVAGRDPGVDMAPYSPLRFMR